MAKLLWEDSEQGYTCSVCGGRFLESELNRAFGYGLHIRENFERGCCFDCGSEWTDIEEK